MKRFVQILFLVIPLCFSSPLSTAQNWTSPKTVKKSETTRPAANVQNLDWDLKLGRVVYQSELLEVTQQGKKVDAAEARQLVTKLNRVMQKLRPHSRLPEMPFQVHLVEDSLVNAFCLPGGGIVFFRGIFDEKEGLIRENDEDEIAAVMAHEMGHATLRHSYRRVRAIDRGVVLGQILSIGVALGAGRDLASLLGGVYYAGLLIAVPRYSRKMESEADLEGLYTMIEAGYNPEKMIHIWERAAQKRKGRDLFTIFADHPTSGERAKVLKRHLANIRVEPSVKR